MLYPRNSNVAWPEPVDRICLCIAAATVRWEPLACRFVARAHGGLI